MKIRLSVLLLVIAVLVGALLSPTGAQAQAPPEHITVCHQQGQGNWKPLSLPEPAANAHLGHGDPVPGDVVPGELGVKFDDMCTAIPFTTVVVAGPEQSGDEAAIAAGLDALTDQTGVATTYVVLDDVSAVIEQAITTGEAPAVLDPATGAMTTIDVLMVPTPSLIAPLLDASVVVPASETTAAAISAGWNADWVGYGTVDDTLYGVPARSYLKSLVWFKPSTFVDPSGVPYPIPSTWDDLVALTDTIIANGQTPWCVGIESGPATGWNFTDWVEDRVLGTHGGGLYDAWVANDIAFTDTRIRQAWSEVRALWQTPGAVFEGLATAPAPGVGIAQTNFFDSIINMVAADQCLMHRQASFLADIVTDAEAQGQLPPGTVDSLDTFAFPGQAPGSDAVTGAGLYAVSLRSDVEVALVHAHVGSADYADARRAVQPGFLSAVTGQDLSGAPRFTADFTGRLQQADTFRFDASDLMPSEIGSGALESGAPFDDPPFVIVPSQPTGFWGEGTRVVIGDGNTSVNQFLGFEEPNIVFGGDVDGTTVEDATQTLAALFCAVALGSAC